MAVNFGDPHGERIGVEEHTVFLALLAGGNDLAFEQSEDHAELDEEFG